MIVDTSEAYSSDNVQPAVKKEGNNSDGGFSSSSKTQEQDSYFKVKMHAMVCLQILFKANNKSFNINTLWHPIFPSFLIQPRPELASPQTMPNLMDDKASRDQFASKTAEEVLKEPTLFYLMHAKSENNCKFRQAACQTVTTLLENSDLISKWQYILEKKATNQDGEAII